MKRDIEEEEVKIKEIEILKRCRKRQLKNYVTQQYIAYVEEEIKKFSPPK